MRSLNLIVAATEQSSGELLAALFQSDSGSDVARDNGERREISSNWRVPDSETRRVLQRLNKASELTATRTNTVRNEPGLPVLTLQDQLYVRRDRAAPIRTTSRPASACSSSAMWRSTARRG